MIEVSELADYIDLKVPDFSFEAFKLRQIPQKSIVGNNFASANRTDILATANGTSSAPSVKSNVSAGTAIPNKPTHIVVTSNPIDVFETIAADGKKGALSQQLTMGTPVVVMKSAGGWDLIAKDGKTLGYVAHAGLAALQ
jgi:hypothetical protein